jgi:hypothetical protein
LQFNWITIFTTCNSVQTQAKEMISELQRDDFLKLIAEPKFTSDSWLIVCLIIPTEWLHELDLPKSYLDGIIECGKKIITALNNGSFSRIGWSSFFCITDGDKQEVIDILQSKKASLESQYKECRLWKISVMKLDAQCPLDVFTELELQAHREARENGQG